MQSQHGIDVSNQNVIKFGSGMNKQWIPLSNFYDYIMMYRGKTYPSSEHAFQAQLLQNTEQMEDFVVGGKYADYECMYEFYPKLSHEKIEQKIRYWKKKNCIGILAKMAIGRIKKSGGKRSLKFWECESTFERILSTKFSHPDMKKIITSTSDSYLLEYDRFGTHRKSRWGGTIDNGKIHGDNQMGALIMNVRKQFMPMDGERLRKWMEKKGYDGTRLEVACFF